METIYFIFQKNILLCSILGILTLAACAQEELPAKLPEALKPYVDAYVNVQLEQLSSFYNASSTFQDPTLALIDIEAAKEVTGRERILEKLKRNFKGVRQPTYRITDTYTVGDITILTGSYSYTQNAINFGGPDKDIHFTLKSTTIIKYRDEQVWSHLEYMDYASWFTQFNQQKDQ